jgi:LmbE family N-acetylglucosaminyl deacetylase
VVRVEERNSGAVQRMMSLIWNKSCHEPLTILCLGAHSDDIEIGCGATLLQLSQSTAKPKFCWVVLSAKGERETEARRAAELFTAGCDIDIFLKDFRDGYLPHEGSRAKDFFEDLKSRVKPDVIFTHWHGDAHQDHRLVNELTWNTFRNHLILEYEIPKFDGDMGRPGVFVALEEWALRQKVSNLAEAFKSQSSKPWFSNDTFLGLMRLRGMESNSPSGYAEAFYARKLLIDTPTRK